MNIMFNVNYKEDPVLAEIINNYDFKKALSYAIDREEINNVRFMGLGRPSHGHFHPEHPGYVEEVDQAYIEYNPELANQILDELGLTARDSEGYRLRPDGQRLTIIIDGSTHHDHHGPGGELIASYWEAVESEQLSTLWIIVCLKLSAKLMNTWQHSMIYQTHLFH